MLYSVWFSTKFTQLHAHGQSDFIARDTDQWDQLIKVSVKMGPLCSICSWRRLNDRLHGGGASLIPSGVVTGIYIESINVYLYGVVIVVGRVFIRINTKINNYSYTIMLICCHLLPLQTLIYSLSSA